MSYQNLFDELSVADVHKSSAEKYISLGFSTEQASALSAPVTENAVISAGAGAGKTKVLVERAAQLVAAGAEPAAIAVVTFTRKSAEEIKARLRIRLGSSGRVPVCATVHALALAALLKEGNSFELASDEDIQEIISQVRLELPDEYADFSDKELELKISRTREETRGSAVDHMAALRYAELLEASGKKDFTSLLSLALNTRKTKFSYMLVDEAQDLSRLQLQVIKKLGGATCRYWFIGDADQSIYAFRGAKGDMMQELVVDYKNHFVLSKNYRSSINVVTHSNNVIRNNSDRIDIERVAVSKSSGTVVIKAYPDATSEISAIRAWACDKAEYVVIARTQAMVDGYREQGLNAITAHESKGLEWQNVWVAGCEACLFPHPLAPREEERRLFYVAMTRAKHELIMSYVEKRSDRKGATSRAPSPFLFETQALAG